MDLKSSVAWQASEAGGNSSNTEIDNKQLNHKFHVVSDIYQQTSLQWLLRFTGSCITSSKYFNYLLSKLSFRLKDHYKFHINIWDLPKSISQTNLQSLKRLIWMVHRQENIKEVRKRTAYLMLRYIDLVLPVEKLPLNKSQWKVFSSGIKKFSSQYKEHHHVTVLH